MSATDKLARFRLLLAEHSAPAERRQADAWTTGLPAWDEQAGGLPPGAITEIVAGRASCGSQLLLGQLLAVARARQARAAWIDAGDQFDPSSFPADLLAHLVWVRCRSTTEALAATDLLARDANLSLVILDLVPAPLRDLRRIPSPTWYRLQRAVEPTDLALVVTTPQSCVPSAHLRFELPRAHAFAELENERAALLAQLAPALQRQRRTLAAG